MGRRKSNSMKAVNARGKRFWRHWIRLEQILWQKAGAKSVADINRRFRDVNGFTLVLAADPHHAATSKTFIGLGSAPSGGAH